VATLAELEARLEALRAQRDSAMARISYDGRSVEYRGTADIAQTRFSPSTRRALRPNGDVPAAGEGGREPRAPAIEVSWHGAWTDSGGRFRIFVAFLGEVHA
jgi:hypothetical protein